MKTPKFRKQFSFNYVYYFLISIFLVRILVVYFDQPNNELLNSETYVFVSNFIGWFGVLYGVLLPLILIRVWEQLDKIDREFDKEANAVRLLYEDVRYLQISNGSVGREIAQLLRDYVVHVINHYSSEVKGSNNVQGSDNARIEGDKILEDIRRLHQSFLLSKKEGSSDLGLIESEIYYEIRELVDIRANRIDLASQRLFESLRLVALLASIIFITPFYIIGFASQASLLSSILILGVTLLVIFIYLIIEDFDEPFGGVWKIDPESWNRVLMNIDMQEPVLSLSYKQKKSNKNRQKKIL